MPQPAAAPDDDPDPADLSDDELDLLRMFRGLRPASRFHLRQALAAQDVDGVTGTLVVKIPRKPGPVDVAFVGGEARLQLDL